MIQYLQFTLLGILLLGDYLMPIIGIQDAPDLYKSAKENKGMVFLMLWLGGNMIINSLLSTGGFEITLDGRLPCCYRSSHNVVSALVGLPHMWSV
jgi:hypothetical protein